MIDLIRQHDIEYHPLHHLEWEVDGGVEGFLDLDLALAVHHPVVADVELEVSGVGDGNLGLEIRVIMR